MRLRRAASEVGFEWRRRYYRATSKQQACHPNNRPMDLGFLTAPCQVGESDQEQHYVKA